MIRTFGLNKCYGKFQAVQDLDLSVGEGDVFGFLGLNGAGKTTVMRMLCGLLRPSGGYSKIGDVEIRGPQDTEKLLDTVSFVSQELKFFEHSTLLDLLEIYAALAGVTTAYGKNFAEHVGVPLDRPCGRLSPGQQRKAQLAIALLKRPRYLLLDEPTAGLDPQGVAEVREIIRQLHALGTTVFLSSHILAEVQALCTSVGILHRGNLAYQGPIKEAYTINISENIPPALETLAAAGFSVAQIPGGIRIGIGQDHLPEIIKIISSVAPVGLVQPASLEDLFNQVISADTEVMK